MGAAGVASAQEAIGQLRQAFVATRERTVANSLDVRPQPALAPVVPCGLFSTPSVPGAGVFEQRLSSCCVVTRIVAWR